MITCQLVAIPPPVTATEPPVLMPHFPEGIKTGADSRLSLSFAS